MNAGAGRILTTHVGSLPRSQAVTDVLFAREREEAHETERDDAVITEAVAAVVRRQVEVGIDITTEFGFSTCPPNNPLAFDNTVQILETGGLRIALWGDNRPEPGWARRTAVPEPEPLLRGDRGDRWKQVQAAAR
jgi:hypothetical protein